MEKVTTSQLVHIKDWLGAGSINIFGMPYAGKDTHGNRLAQEFDAPLLGGGDILRNSVIPEHVKTLMHAGELVPIEDYIRIVLPYFSKPEFANRPLILSSVGRWYGEQDGVMGACKSSGHSMKAVIYLQLHESVVRERFANARALGDREERADDAEEILGMRIKEFHTKTLPVIEFYRNAGLLIEVDGTLPVQDVATTILQELFSRASASQ